MKRGRYFISAQKSMRMPIRSTHFSLRFTNLQKRGAAVLDVMTWIDKLLTHTAAFTKEDGGMNYNSNSNNSAVSVTNTDRLVVSARLLRYMFDSNNDFTTSDEIPAKADSLDSTRNVTEMCVSALEHSKALDAQYAASTAVRDDFAWEDARILRSQRRAEEVVTFLHNFYDAAQRTLQLKSVELHSDCGTLSPTQKFKKQMRRETCG